MTTGLNAGFNGNIFQKDNPIILATKRELAVMQPVVLAYDSGSYPAGQVLALNSVSGLYQKYSNGGASGTGTAVCVLFQASDMSNLMAGQTDLGNGIFAGHLYQAKLVGLDANAISNLGAHSYTPSNGAQILKF